MTAFEEGDTLHSQLRFSVGMTKKNGVRNDGVGEPWNDKVKIKIIDI